MIKPKKLQAVLMCMALFYFSGCDGQSSPTPKWRVRLLRPDGETQQSWIVTSAGKPKALPVWGGQTVLHRDDLTPGFTTGRYVSLDIVAPVGWCFTSERIESK